MSLSSSALLSTLTIKQWSARKYDREVSEQICEDKGATPGSGNFNKQLIPKEFLKKVQRIVNTTRNYHYDNTLAWGHDGTDLLPANHYMTYMQAMQNYKNQFDTAVNEFIKEYPSFVTKVINELNDLYNSSDYPSQDDLRKRFDMDFIITPVPETGDFRVDLPAIELAKMEKDLGQRLVDANALAEKDLYMRLYTVVAKAVVVLKTPGKIFRNSLILNIIDITDKTPALNFNGDIDLDYLAKQIGRVTAQIDIEALRDKEDEVYRADMGEDLSDLLKDIEKTFINKWGAI